MRRPQFLVLLFFSFLVSSDILSTINGTSNAAASLDSIIQDYSFRIFADQQTATGVIYDVPLPSNLSGINASAIRLRSNTLWKDGQDMILFNIPPSTIPSPYKRRIILVYENFGNRSSSYYKIPGYSLVAPVVGLSAYDASNVSSSERAKADALGLLLPADNLITIKFGGVALPGDLKFKIKCARFEQQGLVELYNTTSSGSTCTTNSTGHFTIVVPTEPVGPPPPGSPQSQIQPPAKEEPNKGKRWWIYAVICGGVFALLLVMGIVYIGTSATIKRRKIQLMENIAEENEALETVQVAGSRMSSASAMRTQPTIEN